MPRADPQLFELHTTGTTITSAWILMPSTLTGVIRHGRVGRPTWFMLHESYLDVDDSSLRIVLDSADTHTLLQEERHSRRRWQVTIQPARVFTSPLDEQTRMATALRINFSKHITSRIPGHAGTLHLLCQAIPAASPSHPRSILRRLRLTSPAPREPSHPVSP